MSSHGSSASTFHLALACGLILLLAFAAFAVQGRFLPSLPFFLTIFGLAFTAYGIACWRLYRIDKGRVFFVVLGVAVASRLLCLVPDNDLSDDIYRYLWEGRVGNHGVNPFTVPPDDPSLEEYRDELHAKVTHREIPAVYPPLSQWSFRLADWLGGTPRLYRFLILLADLTTFFLLVRTLQKTGRPLGASIIHGWNPLLILELCGSGHLDGLALPFVVLGLSTLMAGKLYRSVVAIALGTLVKLHAVLLLPLLLWPPSLRRKETWICGLLFVLIVVAGYAPYFEPGMGSGLGSYAEHWSFNSPAHDLTRAAAVSMSERLSSLAEGPYPFLLSRAYAFHAGHLTRFLLTVILVGGLALVYAHRRASLPQRALAVFTLFMFLTPTLHPWYLTWLVPLLVFVPYPPCLLLTATAALSYTTVARYQATGEWSEQPITQALEFGPVVLLILFDVVRRLRLKSLQMKRA